MKKPTPKQIGLKTTWSPEDEVEFFQAMGRLRSDHARLNLLAKRAKSISVNHPTDAARLQEMILSDYPDCQDYQERVAVRELAKLYVQLGEPGKGASRLHDYARERTAQDNRYHYALTEFLYFVAEHACAEHYRNVLELVPLVEHIHPDSDEKPLAGISSSWALFGGAAYCAHLLGDEKVCSQYLKKAKEWCINDHWRSYDPWRLWLFQQVQVGSRPVAPVLVRPEFTLAEMRDWADGNWKKFRPEITYNKSEDDERLILAWDEFIVDLILNNDPKKAVSALSFFKKKNLGKFDTEDARALGWKDAGDYDAVDAINISIELLDYFQSDPRVVVDIG